MTTFDVADTPGLLINDFQNYLRVSGTAVAENQDRESLVQYLRTGFHDRRGLNGGPGPDWKGAGITSSSCALDFEHGWWTGIGYEYLSEPLGFHVKLFYTWLGTTTDRPERVVNSGDLGTLSANWQSNVGDWVDADFTYDVTGGSANVDIDDLYWLTTNWGRTTAQWEALRAIHKTWDPELW